MLLGYEKYLKMTTASSSRFALTLPFAPHIGYIIKGCPALLLSHLISDNHYISRIHLVRSISGEIQYGPNQHSS